MTRLLREGVQGTFVMGARTDVERVRLHVFLARAGAGSRRGMEAAIRDGRVRVDGEVVRMMGTKIDPRRARVMLDGQRVSPATTDVLVVALHKPVGVVTTVRDPEGRETVMDLLPNRLRGTRLYPVGRLDFMSEGLVLMTNDGALAHRLMHPRFGHEREYEVKVRGRVPRDLQRQFSVGVAIGDVRRARAEVRSLRYAAGGATLRLVLREGRNRQVRRMFEVVGVEVRRLRRIRVASVHLGSLAGGRSRVLGPEECAELAKMLS